jgi:hypothetical protein
MAELPDKWFCALNVWDSTAATCVVPISKSTEKKGGGAVDANPLPAATTTGAKRGRKRAAEQVWEDFGDELGEVAEDEESQALVDKLRNEDSAGSDGTHWVRRSGRASGQSELSSRQLKELLVKIKGNHQDIVVFKLKDHLGADANTWIMDSVLKALCQNTNCQALYIQNFSEAVRDPQLKLLTKVLARSNIWCLNIGETYNISPRAWEQFANALVHTKVTHMYASEHTISSELKTQFRDIIRANRKKHSWHNSIENLDVIESCTNM